MYEYLRKTSNVYCYVLVQARELYEEALAAGDSAFLVQQQTNMLDVFTCSVGNLNPNDTTKVQLTYLMNVEDEGYRQGDKVEGDDYAFRLVVPMAVAPRYTPFHSDPTMGSYDMGQAIQLRGLLRIEGEMLNGNGRIFKTCVSLVLILNAFQSHHVRYSFSLRLCYHVILSSKHLQPYAE